jgi:hypothetical protein
MRNLIEYACIALGFAVYVVLFGLSIGYGIGYAVMRAVAPLLME